MIMGSARFFESCYSCNSYRENRGSFLPKVHRASFIVRKHPRKVVKMRWEVNTIGGEEQAQARTRIFRLSKHDPQATKHETICCRPLKHRKAPAERSLRAPKRVDIANSY